MNRNGLLMAIWILAALTLVTSLSMAQRSDHGNRGGGGGGDQARADHGNSRQATPSAPAPQPQPTRSSSTYTPPAASYSGSGRGVSSGRSPQSTYTPAPSTGGWQSHNAGQGSGGSSRWESTNRPTYTPQVSGNAGGGSWRSHTSGNGGGGATTVIQPKPTFTPAAPSQGASTGQSWRSHTTGGNVGRDKVGTSIDRPSFTQGSQTGQASGWKAGGDHTTLTPRSQSQGDQGSAVGGSWRDHVRGGTPSGGHTGGGVIAKPQYGTQTGHGTQNGDHGTLSGAQGDHRGRPEFKVEGRRLDFDRDHQPRLNDGHWTAPARPFFDRIGARMWEDQRDHWWHASRGGHEFRFRIGDRHGWCDGREFLFVVAPYLWGGDLYCDWGPFATYFGVPYQVEYVPVPVPYPVYPEGAQIGKGLAIATATEYLRQVGAYPVDVVDVDAHENSAPANRFWDLVTVGRDPIPDAPMVWCWVVEFDYPGGWQQVFVDGRTGEIVGGSAS